MTFIDKSSMIQHVGDDITSLFAEHGWKDFLKYRVFNGSGNPTKFGEVRLFRSVGTDGQIRNLGMVYGYDTSVQQFNDNRYIFHDSNLGLLGIGDGTTKLFQAKVFPMDVEDHIYVYKNGEVVANGEYTLDPLRGTVLFNTAPADGDLIGATYHMASTAPEPATRLVFFTFNSVYLERLRFEGDPASKIGDGDGVQTTFYTATAPIKMNTLRVYIDGILVEPEEYSANLSTGEIVFNVAPGLGKEITVEYTEVVDGETKVKVGDGDGSTNTFSTPTKPIAEGSLEVFVDGIRKNEGTHYTVDYENGVITFTEGNIPLLGHEVSVDYTSLAGGAPPTGAQTLLNDVKIDGSFDPLNTSSLMDAVFKSLIYLNPSLPTVLSFTPGKLFERSLQRDSLMYYWGQINRDRIALFFRPDPSGGPNETFFTPLYVGKLLTQGQSPKRNMVLIGGCNTDDEIKWSKDKKLGINLVDYGVNTANGNSDVNMQQTLGGAYYQKHYLAFITHDIDVDNGDGKFNPSVYTNKYHFSRMFIVHANDGYVGELDDIYAVHPKAIYQMDELEIAEKVTDEHIGTGDGRTKVFYPRRTPKNGTLIVTVNCNDLPETDYTVDLETKAVTLKIAPTIGEEVLVSYEFDQVYRYTLPTTPRTPFRLKETAPYAPIGLAILKENK